MCPHLGPSVAIGEGHVCYDKIKLKSGNSNLPVEISVAVGNLQIISECGKKGAYSRFFLLLERSCGQ